MEKNTEKFMRRESDQLLDYKELLGDYYNFNLESLAQKIKMQTYRPKPRMLYY